MRHNIHFLSFAGTSLYTLCHWESSPGPLLGYITALSANRYTTTRDSPVVTDVEYAEALGEVLNILRRHAL